MKIHALLVGFSKAKETQVVNAKTPNSINSGTALCFHFNELLAVDRNAVTLFLGILPHWFLQCATIKMRGFCQNALLEKRWTVTI